MVNLLRLTYFWWGGGGGVFLDRSCRHFWWICDELATNTTISLEICQKKKLIFQTAINQSYYSSGTFDGFSIIWTFTQQSQRLLNIYIFFFSWEPSKFIIIGKFRWYFVDYSNEWWFIGNSLVITNKNSKKDKFSLILGSHRKFLSNFWYDCRKFCQKMSCFL